MERDPARPTEARPHLRHMPALDGLRGAAVAGVLAFHLDHLTGGFLGVDAFFVLSGFLITSLLLAEHRATGAVRLSQFWSRRARRLLPALLLVLVAVALAASAWTATRDLARVRADGLATLFYVANWHAIWSNQGYWASFRTPSLLQHTWSLAIEEQFYVMWPLAVLAVLRIGRGSLRLLGVVTALLATASAAAMIVGHHTGDDPARVYFGTDTRASSILMGAVLAVVIAARGPVRSRLARAGVELVAIAAVIGLAVAWATVDGQRDWLYEGGLVLCGLAVVAVIAAASHPSPGPVARVLSLPPLQWLGRISYGVYLWHWPMFVLMTPARIGWRGWPLDGARVAATLAVSVVSYRVVEQPIRRGVLVRGRRRWTVAPAAVGAVAVALVLIGAGTDPTLPLSRTISATRPAAAGGGGVGGVGGVGGGGGGPVVTTPPRPLRIMIAGDSVALSVGRGIELVGGEFDVGVLNRGYLGCGVARGTGRIRIGRGPVREGDGCLSWPTRWAADLATYEPDVAVLLVGAWDTADIERVAGGGWEHACQPAFDAWYEGQVRNAVGILGARGTPVVVLDAPYLTGNVVVSVRAEQTRRIDCVDAIYRRVAATTAGAATVALAAHVCPSGPASCLRSVDGVVLREDGVHYDDAGGPAIARWIIPEVLAAAGLR